jgi:peroxiredoxin
LLGIHAPEFDAEKQKDKLKKELEKHRLTHPVAMDNDFANWRAWGNEVWPCIYLIDKKGVIRYRWSGELQWNNAQGDKQLNAKIQELLKEK